MDIVITYVNGLDPVWQADYQEFVGGDVTAKRFRDWGTLKYLLRGISKNMPFVRNVYLVVSGESQVPEWVDRDNVHIVCHRDIIPAEALPTFNCNTIELFLHRIDGIDEQFINFNDDIFPVRMTSPEDFFIDGRPCVKHSRCLLALNLFRKMVRGTDRAARKAAGRRPGLFFLRQQHTCCPMLVSANNEVFDKLGDAFINESLSRVREPRNLTQYLFSDYLFYTGRNVERRISNKHFSLAASSVADIAGFLANPTSDFVCINDVQMTDEKFVRFRDSILAAFEKAFPEKSRFEI